MPSTENNVCEADHTNVSIPNYNVRVLAFDPASTEMGIAVLDHNLISGVSVVVWSETLKGPSLLKYYKNLRPHFANAFCIQTAYYDYVLNDLLPAWNPDKVVSEGAFAGRFIAAMVSLVLVISSIRRAVCAWSGKDIVTVAPTETKQVIAKKGRAGKDEIRAGILQNPKIKFGDYTLLPDLLSEHEFDAIGHGHTYCVKYLPLEIQQKK